MEYPALSVCLSLDDVEKLHSVCTKYSETAALVCDKPITIREVFDIRSEEKRQVFQRMVERSKANLERWTEEQHERALMVAEIKKKRLEDLSAQLQDAKQRKIQERKANVEMELKYLREMEKVEEQRLLKDNINLRKRIEYYQELSDIINENENAKQKGRDHKSKLTLQIPSTSSTQAPPQTPQSTAGTDFESCFGDDDETTSEYEECISDEFVDKFKESEKDLKAIYEENEAEAGTAEKCKTLQPEALSFAQREENSNMVNKYLKRSISDMINSNELHLSTANSMLTNRRKAMSSTSVEQCINTLEVDVANMQTTNSNGVVIDNANNKCK